jgi:O-methyltransferase
MKSIAKALLSAAGYHIVKTHKDILAHGVVEDDFRASYARVRPYTKTTALELYNLYEAVKYVLAGGIAGDLVECGVWKGGSCMMMLLTLLQQGERTRRLYLYDTFQGMPDSGPEDVTYQGFGAETRRRRKATRSPEGKWTHAPFDEVRRVVLSTGYPEDRLVFVRGKVEDTIPGTVPEKIAILRLDTDFYASTRHELEHLYPRLSRGGVLIIDDYDYWQGARQATDEYFGTARSRLLLFRMDVGRLILKPD